MGTRATARAAVRSSLPPLAAACGTFKGFVSNEKCGEQIFQTLLGVIQRHRGAAPKRFYTMREVAAFFGVALGTAETAFRRLGREGALTLVRSSQTMIPARVSRPRFALRGVVCMPIWLPGFLHFMDWRRRFSEMEAELSRHRYVLEPIFFKDGEEVDPAFVDRVLKFNPDYVLWDSPGHSDRMTMESIADAGIPILTILGLRGQALPGRIYRRSYEQGLQRGLAEWKASGEIERIVVPQAGKEHYQEEIIPTLEGHHLPYELKIFYSPASLPQYLKRLASRRRTGIIFSDDLFYSQLCILAPEEMVMLFRRHRVMVMRQVTLPGLTMPVGVRVDALLFPGRQLARRIAADLSQSKGTLVSQEEVFEAEWRPRTPLEDLVQTNFGQ